MWQEEEGYVPEQRKVLDALKGGVPLPQDTGDGVEEKLGEDVEEGTGGGGGVVDAFKAMMTRGRTRRMRKRRSWRKRRPSYFRLEAYF
jgi:hypothetical protein